MCATGRKVHVDEALTRKVADLARLELSDQEVRLFTHQIGEVLEYVDQLQAVDVSQVEPLIHPFETETPLREDIVKPFAKDKDGKSKILSSAPDLSDDGFKVPPIL